MPGFRPETDTVELDNGSHLFTGQVQLAKVRRGTLVAVLPSMALFEPWPDEFLWRRFTLLGVVDAWWSMYRDPGVDPWALTSVHETADQFQLTQHIARDMIADQRAWAAIQQHIRSRFLVGYQEALDEKEQSGEFPASV